MEWLGLGALGGAGALACWVGGQEKETQPTMPSSPTGRRDTSPTSVGNLTAPSPEDKALCSPPSTETSPFRTQAKPKSPKPLSYEVPQPRETAARTRTRA